MCIDPLGTSRAAWERDKTVVQFGLAQLKSNVAAGPSSVPVQKDVTAGCVKFKSISAHSVLNSAWPVDEKLRNAATIPL